MYRTHSNGELRIENVGQEVTLAGWVQKSRDKGFMIWVDLRDRYGITQLIFDADRTSKEMVEQAKTLGREFVIQVKGEVIERVSKNSNIPTGDIEILVKELTILNKSLVPPFTIEDETDGGDELRMKKLEILDEKSRHFSEVSHYKEKFDEQDYVSKRFNMFSGDECKVTLKCNIQLQEEMLDRFGKNIPLTAVDGSHFETTVSATMSDGFVSWLMQYGDGVEVTSPKNLAKMVRDKAKNIYNIYKGKL